MCRNIKMLFNFDPPVTPEEVRAASLQFVRKISGFHKPSKANEAGVRGGGGWDCGGFDGADGGSRDDGSGEEPGGRGGEAQGVECEAICQLTSQEQEQRQTQVLRLRCASLRMTRSWAGVSHLSEGWGLVPGGTQIPFGNDNQKSNGRSRSLRDDNQKSKG